MGNRRGINDTKFLLECVKDLRMKLEELGNSLIVRIGKPEEIIPELAEEIGARHVYCQEKNPTENKSVLLFILNTNLNINNRYRIQYQLC